MKTFRAWALLSENAREKHVLEYRMRFWKARRLMVTWNQTVIVSTRYQELKAIEIRWSSCNKKKRYFRLWRRVARVKRVYLWQPRRLRKIALGCSLFNILWNKALSKTMFSKWRNEVVLHNRIQGARLRHKKSRLRFHFTLWKQSVESNKLQNCHRRLVLSAFQEMNTGSRMESASIRVPPDQNEICSNRKSQESAEMRTNARQRRTQLVLEVGTSTEQKEDKVHQHSWKLQWVHDEKRRLDIVKKDTEKWFSSQEGREKIAKFVKAMERELQFPSILSTSPSTIALSCLDSKLGHRGLVSDEFFEGLETVTKDGKVNALELYDYLENQGCGLSSNSIREIFDEEGGTRITVQDLQRLLLESRSWTGTTEGCQWKRFIDPISQIIGYYNFVENKRVYEYKLNKKTKVAIAKDHFLSTNVIRERRLIRRERKINETY